MVTASPRERPPVGLSTLLIAYAGFVLLGLPDGMLGVAWPSMRRTFGMPLDALGVLLIASMIGFLFFSSGSGRLAVRLGVGRMLLLSSGLRALGLLGFAFAPAWWLLVLSGFAIGLGAGAIDAGLNTYVATHYSAGRLNWLHACFGLGATLGPMLMTTTLNLAQSWQWAYVVAGLAQLALTAIFALTLSRWRVAPVIGGEGGPESARTALRATLRLPALWFGIALFFLYTGIEVTAGQWPYSLFTEGRAVPEGIAGAWVSLYWGGLTAGRVVAGVIVDRIGTQRLLRLSMAGTLVGALLIMTNAGSVLNAIGMALTGFSLAAIFPSLISLTPARVGQAHAANAIGLQVSAAGLGVAALPGLAGVLADGLGLEIIGPFLLGAAMVQWGLYELSARYIPAAPRSV